MKNEVITINNKEILVLNEESEKFVAIRPVSEALGVTFKSQLERIKGDIVLSGYLKMKRMPGKNDKKYKMQTIPFECLLPWLSKIRLDNVDESARQELERYQRKFYDLLFESYTQGANHNVQKLFDVFNEKDEGPS